MHTLFLKSNRIPRGGNENFREMKSLAKDSNALSQETEGVRAPESRRHRELRWSCQFLRCWNILSYVVNVCLEPLECPVWFLLTSTSATQPSDPPTGLPTLQNDGLQASAPAEWPETAPIGPLLLLWVILQYSFASTCWRVEPQNWKVCTIPKPSDALSSATANHRATLPRPCKAPLALFSRGLGKPLHMANESSKIDEIRAELGTSCFHRDGNLLLKG